MGGFRIVVGNLIARLRMDSADFEAAVQQSARKLTQTGAAFNRLGSDLTRNVTVPLTALGVGVVKVGSDFESAFAGVRKTVAATEPEFAALRQGFRDLAKEIPISANELAGLGEAAGQLGIRTENILGFTRVMADLGVTTNLSASEAATALARLSNIMGTNQTDFDRLGSVIVDLGNNFAATEREIVEMGLRLAGAGKQIGLTESQVLGFAAALTSVGIEAEAGGTAFSRVFNKIEKAIATGSANLQGFAVLAGTSVPEFARLFREDAGEAITRFVEGLLSAREQGESVTVILEALGIEGIRVSDSLKRTANAGDLVRDALERGSSAWRENTALTKEAEERYKTFESQARVLLNSLIDVGITLFDAIRPVLVDTVIPALRSAIEVVALLAKGFAELPRPVQTAALALGVAAAAAGPLLFAVGQLIFAWKNVVSVLPAVAKGLQAVAGAQTAAGAASGVAAKAGAGLVGVLSGPVGLVALAAGLAPALLVATGNTHLMREAWEAANRVLEAGKNALIALIAGIPGIDALTKSMDDLGLSVSGVWAIFSGFVGFFGNRVLREVDRVARGLNWVAEALGRSGEQAKQANLDFIQVSHGAGALADETEEAGDETDKASDASKRFQVVLAELRKALEGAASGTKNNADELKRFREAGQAAIDPMGALAAEIKRYSEAGFDAHEISLILAQRIAQATTDAEKMRIAAELLGKSLPTAELNAFTQEVVANGLALNKNAIAAAAVAAEQAKLRQAFRDGTALQDAAIDTTLELNGVTNAYSESAGRVIVNLRKQEQQTRDTLATLKELNEGGVTAERVNKGLSVSVAQLIRDAELFGIEIDENTKRFLAQIGAIQENQRSGSEWRNIWVGAIGNVKDSFVNGLTAMITEGKRFSINLKQIFKDLVGSILRLFINNLFGKLLRSFGNFGTNLANQLGLGGSGPGLLGALGLAGPAAGGGGGGAAGGVALTTGGGTGSALAAFFTNPWTIGIGAALAGFFALRKVFQRGLGDVAQDIQRDFSIAFSTDALKQFQAQFGVSEETFKKFTKSISLSPAFFQFAQQLGVSNDQLIAAFSNVEVFGRRIDLSAEAARAAAGDFSALNARWVELFQNSDQLIAALGGSLESLLVANSQAAAAAGQTLDFEPSAALAPPDVATAGEGIAGTVKGPSFTEPQTIVNNIAPSQNFAFTVNVNGTPADELVDAVDDVIEPRLIKLIRQGTGELRAVITEIVEKTSQGIVLARTS